MAEDGNDGDIPRHEEERRTRFSRLGEQLTGLLDPESALRRGQGLVTGVSKATKDELMRLVGAEVRSFLDKMDIGDLAQQIISGLEVDVRMNVKFSRSSDGKPVPEVQQSSTAVRTGAGKAEERGEGRTRKAPAEERERRAPKTSADEQEGRSSGASVEDREARPRKSGLEDSER